MPQVPQYRNRVTKDVIRAADGRVAMPRPDNYDNGASSMAELGQTISQEGDRWSRALAQREERESAKRQADILLAFNKENSELLNGKVDEEGNTIAPGLLASELENAKGTASTYLTKGNELMGKYLAMAKTKGEQQYLERALGRAYQNSYDRMISHELDQTRTAAAKSTKAYFDTAKGMAGAITKPQDMREHLDDLYLMSDKEGRANGLDGEALKAARYSVANDNVSASVEGAVLNQNLPAARNVLEGAKKDLLPADYNALNAYIRKAELTQEKAKESAGADALYLQALARIQNDADGLQADVINIMRNPLSALNDIQKNYGPISAKQLIEWAKYVQRDLLDSPDTVAGQNKRERWQQHEQQFNAFKLDTKKNKIGNKEMNNPQTVLAAISYLNGNIKDRSFDSEGLKKAKEELSHLYAVLGNMTIKEDDTALGEVVKQVNLLINGDKKSTETGDVTILGTTAPVGIPGILRPTPRTVKNYEDVPVGGILTPEEKGVIIETTVNGLQTGSVDLLSTDEATKKQVSAAAQNVARDYVRRKFAIVYDDVTDVQVGNNTFKSYGIKPNANLGASILANLDGYRYEEQNGVACLIKRDKNGNELHKQLL